MARYARIMVKFWREPDTRPMPPLVKLLYLWSFTNDGCGISGLYVVDLETMSHQTGVNGKSGDSAWKRLLDTGKVIYDPSTSVLWVRGKFGRETECHPGKSPSNKTIIRAVREVHELPANPLTPLFYNKYKKLLMGHPCPIDGGPPPTRARVSLIPIPIPTLTLTSKVVAAKPSTRRMPLTRPDDIPEYSDSFNRLWDHRQEDPGETDGGSKWRAYWEWVRLSDDDRKIAGHTLWGQIDYRVKADRSAKKQRDYRPPVPLKHLERWIRGRMWE